ncbi:hypothetical protein Vadar_032202 [Vaccinium darrowii]|uniref:Uncharacterized protein n=1 Tax=Vaccinium darrowii TaxID=229202 RepID=A0ACB7XMQ2_9ERIC|nr:hypothetical protein Vadar_032202 [Vaccinium darrowii]
MIIIRITRIFRLCAGSLGYPLGFGGGANDINRLHPSKDGMAFDTTDGRGGTTTLVSVEICLGIRAGGKSWEAVSDTRPLLSTGNMNFLLSPEDLFSAIHQSTNSS